MALTAPQEALLQRAILAWIRDQEARNITTWGSKLVTSTAAQRRAALTPFILAIKAQVEQTIAAVPSARLAQDAALQAEVTDADAVVTELGG